MKKFGVLLALATFCVPAFGGQGWTGSRAILSLEFYSGGVEVRLEGAGAGCTTFMEGGVQKTWTRIDATHPNKEQLVAALLVAFSTGKPINVYCANAGDWTGLDRLIVTP